MYSICRESLVAAVKSIRREESVVLRIATYKRALESAKVNVVEAPRSYVIATANLHRCAVITRACAHNCVAMRVLAVTALDVCGTFCVVLRNLTLVLSKARLYAAIRSTTLSFPLLIYS